MNGDIFQQVDEYLERLFDDTDEALRQTQLRAQQADLPAISVSPIQGKLLHLFAKMLQAKRILEIGTLGGYSTIWLARGMAEGGRLVTLEADPRHAEVAQQNIAGAGLDDQVEIIVGPALDALPRLETDPRAPFDLVFIDADKESYPAYLEAAVKLSHPGTVILADNVVRAGAVLNPDPEDAKSIGASQFNLELAEHPELDSIIFQQVGAKGHDGLAIAVVN